MFKKICLLSLYMAFLLILPTFVQAQDDNTPYQKDQELSKDIAFRIRDVYNAYKPKIPTEQTLKNMSLNTNLPANINDILYQYDWLEVGDYFFNPAESSYRLSNTQFELKRYHTTKGVLQFRYRHLFEGTQPKLEFEGNDDLVPKQIVKKGTHFYLADTRASHEPISYFPIVDYKDGLLIVDVTYSGELNDFANPRRFRKMLLAIPKFF